MGGWAWEGVRLDECSEQRHSAAANKQQAAAAGCSPAFPRLGCLPQLKSAVWLGL